MPSESVQNLESRTFLEQLLDAVALGFHLMPKNLLSYITGLVVRAHVPRPLSLLMCRAFARTFKLNMAEAERPITEYRTVEELFTRRLRPGLRSLAAPFASPADGYLARSAPATAGQAVQAKGLTYSLADLVATNAPDLAWYQTIYLAPHNYHRVHSPCTGDLAAVRYLPGMLWPVNGPFVSRISRLFCRNERLVFDFVLRGGGRVYVVMVGAFNVGRMVTPLAPGLVTNALSRQLGSRCEERTYQPPREVRVGDELGTFMLGSTVVIAYDRLALNGISLVRADGNKPILMGQSLSVP